MPSFRVIGGPHDGEEWDIDLATEGEALYVGQVYDCTIEHIYRISVASSTATYDGWIKKRERAGDE